MPHKHATILLILMVLAVCLGAAAGWFWGNAMQSVAWVGYLFLNALKMMVIPLIVASVISGVASLGDVRKLERFGAMTLLYYLATTAAAVFIGLVMVNWIQPGVGISTAGIEVPTRVLAKQTSIGDILLSLVSPNLVAAAADTALLPLILWSMLFAAAVTTLGARGR